MRQLRGFWTKFAQQQKEKEKNEKGKKVANTRSESTSVNSSSSVDQRMGEGYSPILEVNHVGQTSNLPY